MKIHVGVDRESRTVHSLVTTPANVHDSKMVEDLLHGEENVVFGDSAYMGKTEELTMSRRIAMVWGVSSLSAAVLIGLVGRALYPTVLLTATNAEKIFITMSVNLLPPLLAGFIMAGILAATMSSSDSYLLIASSSLARDIYKSVFRKNAHDRQVMVMSRITLIAVSVVGMIIALNENSIIFNVVSFAWAGFGATFGPLMLFSLFWKRTTRSGAIAGMLAGGCTVFIWKLLLKPMGGLFGIYELLPAFLISCLFIFVFSLLSPEPDAAILAEFEKSKVSD
jgi:sodium/proline symporter